MRIHWSLEDRPFFQFIAKVAGAASPNGRFAVCPKCETTHVRQLVRADTLDRFVLLPWTPILAILGAKIYRCGACQVQFYDCRKQAPLSVVTNHVLPAAPSHLPVLRDATL